MHNEKASILPYARVVSSSEGNMGPFSSTRTLLLNSSNPGISKTPLDSPQGVRRELIVVEIVSGRAVSLEDAATSLEKALNDVETISWNQAFDTSGRLYFAILTTLNKPCELVTHSTGRTSFVTSVTQVIERYNFRRFNRLSTLFSVMLFLVATLGLSYWYTSPTHPVTEWKLGSSIGPGYSHLLTPDNVTNWSLKHYDPTKYFIRIDEQALVPIELLDEQELRYQQYLAERYPEKAEMRDSRAWMDPDFFQDPNNFMMPTDLEFHRGHCVRAFRRYWQAKETGHHVCPWDTDYRHMHHCFSMLEEVMLTPGRRNPVGEYSMSWRTKVCSWEDQLVE